MKRISLLSLIITFALCSTTHALVDKDYKFSGYYKSLLNVSETTEKNTSIIDTNRVRIRYDQKLTDRITGTVIFDNEAFLNNIYNTPDYTFIKSTDQRKNAFWDADWVVADEDAFFWRQAIYRAYIHYYTPEFQFTIGKQAVDWSRMRFYHIFDFFQPISPTDIEKDEKIGVDALNMTFVLSDLVRYDFIYAPYRNSDKQGIGVRFGTRIQDYDIFVIAAEVHKDSVIGACFDGYIGQAGFRGEMAYTVRDSDEEFFRASLGMDYTFTPKFTGIVEYFYNGAAKIMDTDEFLSSRDFSQKAMSITKHILGAGLECEITGIQKLNNYVFYDFEGGSLFYNPEFKWNIVPNCDLTIGAQIFHGHDKSEYGLYHNLYYAEMKLYF